MHDVDIYCDCVADVSRNIWGCSTFIKQDGCDKFIKAFQKMQISSKTTVLEDTSAVFGWYVYMSNISIFNKHSVVRIITDHKATLRKLGNSAIILPFADDFPDKEIKFLKVDRKSNLADSISGKESFIIIGSYDGKKVQESPAGEQDTRRGERGSDPQDIQETLREEGKGDPE